ncbi:hypothetical protein CBM2634_U140005 [Cupriavidus taiwanensis]|uniref:Uncharacterized protein n=1 Tax=Cupriavidus taiwanensis TaxID=164546 RepID=A0A375JBF7_9BURK|nr:hypothetical protein CBM2634_U140005 [Cupriavidus taiwanensis]
MKGTAHIYVRAAWLSRPKFASFEWTNHRLVRRALGKQLI